jgi:hypothetical protein
MTSQNPTTEEYCYIRTDWPQEPMTLWRKVGAALAVAMMLALVVLASNATSSPGHPMLVEQGGPYP